MTISILTLNYNTVETMVRLFSWFLVAFLFSVHCLQRQMMYSRLDQEMTNSSLAVLYGEGVSLVHCAGLCTGDDYCTEFLYSETSGHCVGLHCVNKESYSYHVVPASPRMLYFVKGKLSFIILFFLNKIYLALEFIINSHPKQSAIFFFSDELGRVFRSLLLLWRKKCHMGRRQGTEKN